MTTEDSVNHAMPHLETLADLLIAKRTEDSPVIVPFVGAGVSSSAGVPTSSELMHRIYGKLVESSRGDDPIRELFDLEAEELFDESSGIKRLKIFEFAAVVSQFAYGRRVMQEVVGEAVSQATHRPLCYELLAHLAKHKFIDHFVSMNFDLLLDEALEEELAEELHVISGKEDLPGRHALRDHESKRYLIKPFGSLSVDKYKLQPQDVTQYGNDSVWKFILENIFSKPSGNRNPDVVMLLVGYAAAEKAFSKLIGRLKGEGKRQIRIFAVDPVEKLSPALIDLDTKHIRLDADLAFFTILELMRQKTQLKKGKKSKYAKIWTPIARHLVISQILNDRQLRNPSMRFKIELILQAVKSRGTFTIEALGEVQRIRKYSSEAHQVIEELRKHKIFDLQKWDARDSPRPSLAEDFALVIPEYEELATNVLKLLGLDPHEATDEWRIEQSDKGFVARQESLLRFKFLAEQFRQIATAPEIEVTTQGQPYARWLFAKPVPLESIEQLTEDTAEIFGRLLSPKRKNETYGKIEMFGIWVTGEWLFHPDGWAYPFGQEILELMKDGRLELSVILVKIPQSDNVRRQKAEEAREVIRNVKVDGAYRIYEMEWWRHNRRLTLIRYKDNAVPVSPEGIYMRRRHSTPLVSPVRVTGKDCTVLERIFERYKTKARLVEPLKLVEAKTKKKRLK